jgi:hypothetical protein
MPHTTRLTDYTLEEAFALLVFARQERDDAIGAGFHTLVAAAASVGDEGLAIVQVHPVEVAGVDARLIGTVPADIGQLILPEHWPRHRHPCAAMPILAGLHAHITVYTLAQISNQNFTHCLVHCQMTNDP